ncbi:MAG TPA: glutathione S-transferase family protein [Anaeromyxobacteraceae bacterium]|nr:glutathione S-transferase family protein [Anaeromyxobacteraceae bacterium]
MEFFYGHFSGNSARSLFALYEAGLPFTLRFLDTRNGQNRAPDYLAVNPMGKIPALVDGAFQLWESNAINWYLAEKYRATGLLPATIEARAAVQRWLFFQAAHVTPACVPVFRVINRRVQEFWRLTGDPHAAESGRKELARWLPVLESVLLQKEWLEDTFSLGDIAFAPHFWLLMEGGFDFTSYPSVRAWLNRTFARPAWQKTVEVVFATV